MQFSKNALSIVECSEGLFRDAYLDPVGIPTIGFGTIAYPNGRAVEIGDSISDAEASAFLRFDCENTAKDLTSATSGIGLNQNQFDALLSFCYNLGIGALLRSALLAKLKQRDFAGAAAEFPRWNKGHVNGIKVELPGLTTRRTVERALFEKPDSPGVPIFSPPSNVESAVSIKGYRVGASNLLVAFDAAGVAVEFLELRDSSPQTFVAALGNYPNLKTFAFAGPQETIPEGAPLSFSGLSRPVPGIANAPALERGLLVRGMEDSEDAAGNDIREMQSRLVELGYLAGPADGIFGARTDAAVRKFQADHFGRGESDGKAGPKTWAKLWGDAAAVRPAPAGAAPEVPVPGKHFLKLTKTGDKDEFGGQVLTLAYHKDGVFVGGLDVCSGQPRKQTFRLGTASPAGSMEPLPEGKWSIGDILWSNGKDNYQGPVWSSGLGPAKIPLEYQDPGNTARAAIEIHIDWNRTKGMPGTAGCIGILNISDFKTLAGWLRETNPRSLFVDWGLGSCPPP